VVSLGDPEAWKWIVERVDGIIREQGIDYYRQDVDTEPLKCWRDHDTPDRRGMTENLYVQGYLAF